MLHAEGQVLQLHETGLSFEQRPQPEPRHPDPASVYEALHLGVTHTAKTLVPSAAIWKVLDVPVNGRRKQGDGVAVGHPVTVPDAFEVPVLRNPCCRRRVERNLLVEFDVDRVVDGAVAAPIHRQRCFSEILVRGDFGCGSSFGFFTA